MSPVKAQELRKSSLRSGILRRMTVSELGFRQLNYVGAP